MNFVDVGISLARGIIDYGNKKKRSLRTLLGLTGYQSWLVYELPECFLSSQNNNLRTVNWQASSQKDGDELLDKKTSRNNHKASQWECMDDTKRKSDKPSVPACYYWHCVLRYDDSPCLSPTSSRTPTYVCTIAIWWLSDWRRNEVKCKRITQKKKNIWWWRRKGWWGGVKNTALMQLQLRRPFCSLNMVICPFCVRAWLAFAVRIKPAWKFASSQRFKKKRELFSQFFAATGILLHMHDWHRSLSKHQRALQLLIYVYTYDL